MCYGIGRCRGLWRVRVPPPSSDRSWVITRGLLSRHKSFLVLLLHNLQTRLWRVIRGRDRKGSTTNCTLSTPVGNTSVEAPFCIGEKWEQKIKSIDKGNHHDINHPTNGQCAINFCVFPKTALWVMVFHRW